MKHYMDIDNLREFDIDLGDGMTRQANNGAFELGDRVVIEEKIDGSCASIAFNEETGKLEACSKKRVLDFNNTLNGFYHYAQNLDKRAFAPGLIFFGEWTGAKNKIVYDKKYIGRWYVFDIFDTYSQEYASWDVVKAWCKTYGFLHAHLFYDGEFKGWDHVKSFLHSPNYGDVQEGVVIKNMSKLNDSDNRLPFYLKIVNDDFKESMKIRKPKIEDPEVAAEKAKAEEFASQIVTVNRVQKAMLKLRNDNILPDNLSPKDMGAVAKHLPKMIYLDCMKEEPEVVLAMGDYGGKAVNTVTMRLAREIICG